MLETDATVEMVEKWKNMLIQVRRPMNATIGDNVQHPIRFIFGDEIGDFGKEKLAEPSKSLSPDQNMLLI